MTHHIKDLNTGKIVEVYFYHKTGCAYISKNGIRILYFGEYEEID
jgi:hypothetical protein